MSVTVSSTYPDDIDMLLVAPSGENLLIMSDCGDQFDIASVTIIFSDAAGGPLPDGSQITAGTYLPTNYDSFTDTFPGAPTVSAATTLGTFNNHDPNGVWSLYIYDDASGDAGSVSDWSLTITTVGNGVVATSTNNLSLGTTGQGFASTAQSYTLTGTSLINNLNVTAPTGVEVSSSGAGGPYFGSLALTPSGGNVNATIHARISAAAAAGAVSGNIVNSSIGANTMYVAVSGTVDPPEIDVQRNSVSIASGGTDNAGNITLNVQQTFTYDILNTGSGMLSVGTVNQSSWSGNVNWNITSQPPATIGPTSSGSFTIDFTVTAPGTFNFSFTFANTDPDEGTYAIIVMGNLSPLMSVTGPVNPVVPGQANDVGQGLPVASAFTLTYTIQNAGQAQLNLTPPGSVSAMNNCSASVSLAPAASVAISAQTTLEFTVTAPANGTFTFFYSIATNDPTANPFTWTVSGLAGTAAEIVVIRSSVEKFDGGMDDLGSGHSPGTPISLSYSIVNVGNMDLILTPPGTISAMTNCNASITTAPAGTVTFGTTLDISVTPAANGAFSFNYSIANNDPDEDPFNWTVSGTAGSVFPEMAVARSGAIADGGTDSLGGGHTAAMAIVLTYTINNTGTAPLSVTPPGTLGSNVNCMVAVTLAPAASIGASGNSQLEITVTPTVDGAFSFTYSIANDDPNENPYNWTVSGTAGSGGGGGDGGGGDSGGCSTNGGRDAWLLLFGLFAAGVFALRRVRCSA